MVSAKVIVLLCFIIMVLITTTPILQMNKLNLGALK